MWLQPDFYLITVPARSPRVSWYTLGVNGEVIESLSYDGITYCHLSICVPCFFRRCICISLYCLCQSIAINNNKYVYRQSQVRMPNGSGVRWAECLLIIGTGCRVQVFSLILDSSVGLSAGIQSAGDWVSETLWVRILHSAEEDNLSPFDSKIACLCQSIEITNNKHVYRQSQVRKPTGSEVEWAECLLIIGTGCRVQFFSLILDSSVGLSAGIQSAGE